MLYILKEYFNDILKNKGKRKVQGVPQSQDAALPRLTLYFFYQGTVSAIKFRKCLTKFKITIALPKNFGRKNFITAVKVNKI